MAPGEPVEFILIGEQSGHGYEAFAVAHAQPSDITRALVHAGMTPGRPVDYKALRFWPRGERVEVTFEWTPPAASGRVVAVRAEDLILDAHTSNTLPRVGFPFIGSEWVPDPDATQRQVFAADYFEPHAILSLYNLSETVMDVPWQAAQSVWYGSLSLNPMYELPAGHPVTAILRPEQRADRRARDVRLTVEPAEGGAPRFVFREGDADRPLAEGSWAEVARKFGAYSPGQYDWFVQVGWESRLALSHVVASAEKLRDVEGGRLGFRIEPPAPGDLYFKAFLPSAALRNPGTRSSQPWELHVWMTNAADVACLRRYKDELWSESDRPPALQDEIPLKQPEDAATLVGADDLPVLIVFAPADLSYGRLLEYLRPLQPTHRLVHVFVAK